MPFFDKLPYESLLTMKRVFGECTGLLPTCFDVALVVVVFFPPFAMYGVFMAAGKFLSLCTAESLVDL